MAAVGFSDCVYCMHSATCLKDSAGPLKKKKQVAEYLTTSDLVV